MTRKLDWHLRRKMAEQDIYKTTELGRRLAEKGVSLSREQVYRLVTSPPQRLNMEVLDALCQVLDCTPNDLITFEEARAQQPKVAGGAGADLGGLSPVPARIVRPHHP